MRHVLLAALLLLCPLRLGAGEAGRVVIAADATARIAFDGRAFAELVIGGYDPTWNAAKIRADGTDGGAQRIVITLPDGAQVRGRAAFTAAAGRIHAVYRFEAERTLRMNSLYISLNAPVENWAGGHWSLGAQEGLWPPAFGQVVLANAAGTAASVTAADGRRLGFAMPQPVQVLVQDNRRWGPTCSLRIGPQGLTLEPGHPVAIEFDLDARGGLALEIDQPVTIAAGPEWIPLEDEADIAVGSALDVSAMTPVPAAAAGRLVITPEGHFAMAGALDRPLRFWGVNLCFTSCYPEHADADRLTQRLRRLGYNAVRLHHYDDALVGGKPGAEGFDAAALDKIDYLVAACVREGIWITTDLFVSRPVSKAQLGLAGDGAADLKELLPVADAAFTDWSIFARRLLEHVNPYTSRRWADEPALAWLSLVNEGNLGNSYRVLAKDPAWKAEWNRWLVRSHPTHAALAVAWPGELAAAEDPAQGGVEPPADLWEATARSAAMQRFLGDQEATLFARGAAVVRALGCTALLSNANGWTNPAGAQRGRTAYDYVDDHFYIDHPVFLDKPWRLPSRNGNRNPLLDGAIGGADSAFVRLEGKPFTLTEFNYTAPGRHRAMGGALTGALAAVQDWDAVWRFAYSHNASGFDGGSLTYFDLAKDPLNLAADRIGLLLFRSAALAPATVEADVLCDGATATRITPVWSRLAWSARVGSVLPGQVRKGALVVAAGGPESRLDEAAMARRLGLVGAGPVRIDRVAGTLAIATPAIAVGWCGAGGTVEAVPLRIERSDQEALVAVNACDGQPIALSRRLLLTHLTDLLDTGMRFGEADRQTLLAWGARPHLVRAGTAVIHLAVPGSGWKRYALSTGGRRVGELPVATEAGGITFRVGVAGPKGACMLYELVRE